eukprot:GHVL01029841.1.p1 GENE.GHVL01029841.1~~GHVL01029841.1.p1  ORF type:complete len:2263 (+),score=406.87 GHVL01029841.1:170-6958(+)
MIYSILILWIFQTTAFDVVLKPIYPYVSLMGSHVYEWSSLEEGGKVTFQQFQAQQQPLFYGDRIGFTGVEYLKSSFPGADNWKDNDDVSQITIIADMELSQLSNQIILYFSKSAKLAIGKLEEDEPHHPKTGWIGFLDSEDQSLSSAQICFSKKIQIQIKKDKITYFSNTLLLKEESVSDSSIFDSILRGDESWRIGGGEKKNNFNGSYYYLRISTLNYEPIDLVPHDPHESICGDGKMSDKEECDDGNVTNGDGCDCDCTLSCPEYSFADTGPGYRIEQVGDWSGSLVKLTCDDGYETVNKNETENLTCFNGNWTPKTLLCTKNCPIFETSEGVIISNDDKTNHHTSLRVLECDDLKGYASASLKVKQESVVCLDGEWSMQTLTCKKSCGEFPKMSERYSLLGGSGMSHGSWRDIQCSKGYEVYSGDEIERRYCSDGSWTTQRLVCYEKCENPKEVSGYTFKLSTPPSLTPEGEGEGERRGEMSEWDCAQSFIRIAGPESESEDLNCFDGKFHTRTLRCTEKCEDFSLPEPQEAYFVVGEGSVHGSSRVVGCASGYTTEQIFKNEELYCSRGKWSTQTIQCKESCPEYPDPGAFYHVSGNPDELNHLSSRVLSCVNGYSSITPSFDGYMTSETVTCYDGQWTDTTLICNSDCEEFPIPSPANRYKIDPNYPSSRAGVKVVVSCVQPFRGTFENEQNIFCLNGLWTPMTLRCNRLCSSFDVSDEYLIVGGEGLRHGNWRSVKCGGGSSKEEIVVCVDGEWSPLIMKCHEGCGPFPFLPKNFIISGLDTEVGSYRQIKCADGYNSTPSEPTMQTVHCTEAGWDRLILRCEADCGDFELDEGYIVEGDKNSEGSQEYLHGSELEIKCAAGYDIVWGHQPNKIVCTSGKWSPLQIECSPNCDKFSFLPRNYEVSGSGLYQGAQRTVICAPGFFNSDNPNLQSQKIECRLGKWDFKTIICTEDCSEFKCPDRTPWKNCKYKKPEVPSLRHGSSFKLMCNSSFAPTNKLMPLEDIIECSSGSWSHRTLQCEPQCPPYESLHFSYIVKGSGSSHGDYRDITCNTQEGYYSEDEIAEERVICMKGKWTHYSLSCRKACDLFLLGDPLDKYLILEYPGGPPANDTSVDNDEPMTAPRGHGAWRRISCRPGTSPHSGHSPDDIYCMDGTWTSRTLECRENCPVFIAPTGYVIKTAPPQTSDYTKHGFTYEIECDEANGYVTPEGYSSSEFILCFNGSISPIFIICKKICDLDIGYIEEGTSVTGEDTRHASTILVECRSGYKSERYENEKLKCIDGHRETATIECLSSCMKPLPLSPYYSVAQSSGLNHGAVQEVSCSQGSSPVYGPVSGTDRRICINGVWSDLSIQCTVNCIPPPEFTGLKYQGGGQLTHGASRNVTCDEPNYSSTLPDEDETIIICSRGSWTLRLQSCKRTCGDPVMGNINGGFLLKSRNGKFKKDGKYPHQTQLEVKCSEGYSEPIEPIWKESPPEFLTCHDGIWSHPVKRCFKNCEKLPHLNSAYYRYGIAYNADYDNQLSQFVHGTKMVVQCWPESASMVIGSDPTYITCTNGHWFGVLDSKLRTVLCSPKCESFGTKELGAYRSSFSPTLKGYRFEDVVLEYETPDQVKIVGEIHEKISKKILETADETVETVITDYEYIRNDSKFVNHGTKAVVTCQTSEATSTTHENIETRTCAYGEWSPRTLHCASNCGNFELAEKDKIAEYGPQFSVLYHIEGGGESRHGDVRRVRCSQYFDEEQGGLESEEDPEAVKVSLDSGWASPSGLWSETAVCQYGQWTPVTTKCRVGVMFRWTRRFDPHIWMNGPSPRRKQRDRPSNTPAISRLISTGYAMSAWRGTSQGNFRMISTTYLVEQGEAVRNPGQVYLDGDKFFFTLLVDGDVSPPDLKSMYQIYTDEGTDNDENHSIWKFSAPPHFQCIGTLNSIYYNPEPKDFFETFIRCLPKYCLIENATKMNFVADNKHELSIVKKEAFKRGCIRAEYRQPVPGPSSSGNVHGFSQIGQNWGSSYDSIVPVIDSKAFPKRTTAMNAESGQCWEFESNPRWDLLGSDGYKPYGRFQAMMKSKSFQQELDWAVFKSEQPLCSKDIFNSYWTKLERLVVTYMTSEFSSARATWQDGHNWRSKGSAYRGRARDRFNSVRSMIPLVYSYYNWLRNEANMSSCKPVFGSYFVKPSTCHWKFCGLSNRRGRYIIGSSSLTTNDDPLWFQDINGFKNLESGEPTLPNNYIISDICQNVWELSSFLTNMKENNEQMFREAVGG